MTESTTGGASCKCSTSLGFATALVVAIPVIATATTVVALATVAAVLVGLNAVEQVLARA